jgi:hypothetical protein
MMERATAQGEGISAQESFSAWLESRFSHAMKTCRSNEARSRAVADIARTREAVSRGDLRGAMQSARIALAELGERRTGRSALNELDLKLKELDALERA